MKMFSIVACLLFLRGSIVIVAEEFSTEYNNFVPVAAANIETNTEEQIMEFDLRSCDDALIHVYHTSSYGYDITIRQSAVSEIFTCYQTCGVVEELTVEEAFCWTYASFWVRLRLVEKILEFGTGCEKDKSVLAAVTTWEDFRMSEVHVSATTKADWKFGDSSRCYISKYTPDNTSALTATTDVPGTAYPPQQSPANGSSQAVVTTQATTKRQGSSASAPGATALSFLSAVVVKMSLYS